MNTHAIEQIKIQVFPDGRIDPENTAIYLGRTPKTLAEWRCKGIGPRFIKVGGRVFYWMRDLEAFRDTGARQAA